MKRIQDIFTHPLYQEQLSLLMDAEKDRIFCRHTVEHFLDVARLMYLYNLEDSAGLEKELIYAAAFLHDIGRYEQIANGTPHDIASARMAKTILNDCGFSDRDILAIQDAILHHRGNENHGESHLARYLYRADKQSRNCFCCPASRECNWPLSKKNMEIDY